MRKHLWTFVALMVIGICFVGVNMATAADTSQPAMTAVAATTPAATASPSVVLPPDILAAMKKQYPDGAFSNISVEKGVYYCTVTTKDAAGKAVTKNLMAVTKDKVITISDAPAVAPKKTPNAATPAAKPTSTPAPPAATRSQNL